MNGGLLKPRFLQLRSTWRDERGNDTEDSKKVSAFETTYRKKNPEVLNVEIYRMIGKDDDKILVFIFDEKQ